MNAIYGSPVRVYLVLSLLGILGVYSGLQLPVSLFPNSSKPRILVGFDYGSTTADEFNHTYGKDLEYQLRNISTPDVKVEWVRATYRSNNVKYSVEFEWGNSPTLALRELQNTVQSFTSRLPEEIRDSNWIWLDNENSGFFAASYYSPRRNLHEVYEIVEPVLSPKIARVAEAQDPAIFNPNQKEVRIELIPEAVASFQIFPRQIEVAVRSALSSFSGGAVVVGTMPLTIQLTKQSGAIEELGNILVPLQTGKHVHLSDIARIDFGPQTNARRVFKTSGASSLILFAQPKPGGNIKRMSEDLIAIIEESQSSFPDDIQYKIIVDPSEFIRASVRNVLHEVFLAAGIAVIVLFIFIGSLKNVATAAIEIPLSMVLAFILMQQFGMNLNLISLGGLALSAGMNVDASVVVMENIFRHFEMNPGRHNFSERLRITTEAVREVLFPVIASTISSLVVFLPLAFTSDLSYAILGDLAKAVVFSHGFSAFVALILVPTIRMQLMGRENGKPIRSPIEGLLDKLEDFYASTLGRFMGAPVARWTTYGLLSLLLIGMSVLILPRLPKEIVGKPDTDWIQMDMDTKGNNLIRQMETQADMIEREVMKRFGDRIQYTFNQIRDPNRASLMMRLKDKHDMMKLWKDIEAQFSNTPLVNYSVFPWNPSEMPIPDPPHLRVAIRGRLHSEKVEVARQIRDLIDSEHLYPNIRTEPNISFENSISIQPHADQWAQIRQSQYAITPVDISDLVRVATQGRKIAQMPVDDILTNVQLTFIGSELSSAEEVASLPIGIGSKIVPLKALADVKVTPVDPPLYRENLQDLVLVLGRHNVGDEAQIPESLQKARTFIADWKTKNGEKYAATIEIEEADKDLNNALKQLGMAVCVSILLIFITMVFQFGRIAPALIVLVSVPLGFVGVLGALWIFGSTLSLNSILGVILLNGIAVANSIILVDFILKLVDRGMSPRLAAMEAARKRLRPILITSLTTVLGMLPVAIGMGEGGRILQPLGITVTSGLWVSTILTLFLVPALQVSYLEWQAQRSRRTESTPEIDPSWEPA